MSFSRGIKAVIVTTLVLLAQSAVGQTIPGAADVSRLQNTFENGNQPSQKPAVPPPLATTQAVPPEEAIPENAETFIFKLNGIVTQGVTVYKPGELDALWRGNIGQTVSLKQVYDIAAAITAKYRADGYFLSSAYVPAQKIENGSPRITVVEGYIQEVQLTGKMPSSRLLEQLKKNLLALGPLNVRDLERELLLLNDLPGTHFRALLKALPDAAGNAPASGPGDATPAAAAADGPAVFPAKRDDPGSAVALRVAAAEARRRGGEVIAPGPPPQGAEMLSVGIAARVSAAGPVVFFSPRDNPQGALAAKLSAAGGNAQNTRIVEPAPRQSPDSPPSPEQYAGQLEITLEKLGNVELVVVDPIGAYSGAAPSGDEEIRQALAPIAQAAERHNVPALVVSRSLAAAAPWIVAAAPVPPAAEPWVAAAAPVAPPAVAAPVKEGGIVLEIIGEEAAPTHGWVSLDNSGSRFIGPWTAGAQLSIDRGLPDFQQAIITLNSSVPLHDLKSITGKYIIPLTPDGVKLSVTGSYAEGRPGFTLAPDDLVSDSFSAGTEIGWDAIRQRMQNLRLVAGLDYLNSKTTLLGTDFSDDRIRTARLGVHFDRQDSFNGAITVDSTLKKGLEILGSSHPGDINLSRAKGRPDFTSLAATIYRFQNMSATWNALLGLTAQVSDTPLLSSQQFGYGGQSFGRAYDTSEIVGDSGIAAMAEIRYDGIKMKNDFHLQPFGYYDIGRVWNRAAGLAATDSGASAGLGLRLSTPKGITSALTVAEPLTRAASDPQFGNGKSPRVIFSLGKAY